MPGHDRGDYDVFARRSDGQPLHQVGTVGARTPADAAVFARTLYDEWSWQEMLVAPRTALVRVIRPG
jgi:1,2-phenylacetyl-CoA epoxidase PaaB subunit